VDLFAFSNVAQESDSRPAGESVAAAVKSAFGCEKLKALLVCATTNHDRADVLDDIRRGLGRDVLVAGCWAQGVMSRGTVLEGGFVVGALGSNSLLELDGRPALGVWCEAVGAGPNEVLNQDHTAALAMGIEKRVEVGGREAKELEGRLADKKPRAVLGFECGARAAPFLPATVQENLMLQDTVAPQSPWLGLLARGQVASLAGVPTVHNYIYPLVVLTD
jgi:hypothetical protein